MSEKPAVNAIWIDGPIPELEAVCLHSWAARDYRVVLWIYGDVGPLPPGVESAYAREIYDREILRYQNPGHEGSPILHANLFRYRFLAERGGIFIDTDTLCLHDAPTDPPPPPSVPVVSTEWHDGKWHPNLAWCSAAPGSVCFVECVLEAERRILAGERSRGRFGPKLMKEVISMLTYEARPVIANPHTWCGINWDEATKAFTQPAPALDGALGLHLWSSIVRRNGWASAPHPESIYAEARRAYLSARH